MTDKPKRTFVVEGCGTLVIEAKTPREAALLALNSREFTEDAPDRVDAVEVFERGRGRRYVRTVGVAPAVYEGKVPEILEDARGRRYVRTEG